MTDHLLLYRSILKVLERSSKTIEITTALSLLDAVTQTKAPVLAVEVPPEPAKVKAPQKSQEPEAQGPEPEAQGPEPEAQGPEPKRRATHRWVACRSSGCKAYLRPFKTHFDPTPTKCPTCLKDSLVSAVTFDEANAMNLKVKRGSKSEMKTPDTKQALFWATQTEPFIPPTQRGFDRQDEPDDIPF